MLRPGIQDSSEPKNRRELATDRFRNSSLTTAAPRIVLLDTSFILALTKSHISLRDAARTGGRAVLATTDGVLMELQRLARNGKFETKGLAKIALSLLETDKVEIRETHPSISKVDTGILAVALGDRHRVDVATIDRRLTKTLSTLGISVLKIHNKGKD